MIDVEGVDELVNGMTATARFLFWNPAAPDTNGTIPFWAGRVIGQASELRPLEQ